MPSESKVSYKGHVEKARVRCENVEGYFIGGRPRYMVICDCSECKTKPFSPNRNDGKIFSLSGFEHHAYGGSSTMKNPYSTIHVVSTKSPSKSVSLSTYLDHHTREADAVLKQQGKNLGLDGYPEIKVLMEDGKYARAQVLKMAKVTKSKRLKHKIKFLEGPKRNEEDYVWLAAEQWQLQSSTNPPFNLPQPHGNVGNAHTEDKTTTTPVDETGGDINGRDSHKTAPINNDPVREHQVKVPSSTKGDAVVAPPSTTHHFSLPMMMKTTTPIKRKFVIRDDDDDDEQINAKQQRQNNGSSSSDDDEQDNQPLAKRLCAVQKAEGNYKINGGAQRDLMGTLEAVAPTTDNEEEQQQEEDDGVNITQSPEDHVPKAAGVVLTESDQRVAVVVDDDDQQQQQQPAIENMEIVPATEDNNITIAQQANVGQRGVNNINASSGQRPSSATNSGEKFLDSVKAVLAAREKQWQDKVSALEVKLAKMAADNVKLNGAVEALNQENEKLKQTSEFLQEVLLEIGLKAHGAVQVANTSCDTEGEDEDGGVQGGE